MDEQNCQETVYIQEQKTDGSFWNTALKYQTDHSQGCSWGLVAVTAVTLGTRIVFKSIETFTFTTGGFAELLKTFLKLFFTITIGPWEGPKIWSLEALSSGPGMLFYGL